MLKVIFKMNIQDLRPIKDYAVCYGVKSLIYGPPSSGKTPVALTAPNPIILVTEPGLLSVRTNASPSYQAYTADNIFSFFDWFLKSKETSKFDTLCIDSVSQMCEIILTDELKKNKDGRKAYGELSRKVMEIMNALYFMPNKHLYLIAKEQRFDNGNLIVRRPYYPGQDLNIKLNHLFDQILHLDLQNIPGYGQHKAFRCYPSIDVLARDRTSLLSEYEPPHFGKLIKKCMS